MLRLIFTFILLFITISLFTQSGKVGIGALNPQAVLHDDGAMIFTIFKVNILL